MMTPTTPYLLSVVSLIVAAAFHFKLPNAYWKATLLATFATILISVVAIILLENNFALSSDDNSMASWITTTGIIVGFTAFYGLLISLLVGYFIKAIKSFRT